MSTLENDIKKVLDDVIQVVGKEKVQYQIEVISAPHKSKTLPYGMMAIYMFYYQDKFLKIGKAGPSSNARFNSQHYSPESSNSNLAKSMLNDAAGNPWSACDGTNIGQWIKDNTGRINIYIDEKIDRAILNLFEAILHCKYDPKYEGS